MRPVKRSASVLMRVRGEFLERNLIVSGIELGLFKNEEEDFNIFEVILTTPQRRFELNQHYNDEKFARQEYQKILGELRESLRKR